MHAKDINGGPHNIAKRSTEKATGRARTKYIALGHMDMDMWKQRKEPWGQVRRANQSTSSVFDPMSSQTRNLRPLDFKVPPLDPNRSLGKYKISRRILSRSGQKIEGGGVGEMSRNPESRSHDPPHT
mmetsp:Transcript_7279/g.13607  ORF Transcript_7279/g.13607 Transcript_7279/m.13607 type:complete len:127 (-) Transcript_7279:3-383(-)